MTTKDAKEYMNRLEIPQLFEVRFLQNIFQLYPKVRALILNNHKNCVLSCCVKYSCSVVKLCICVVVAFQFYTLISALYNFKFDFCSTVCWNHVFCSN